MKNFSQRFFIRNSIYKNQLIYEKRHFAMPFLRLHFGCLTIAFLLMYYSSFAF